MTKILFFYGGTRITACKNMESIIDTLTGVPVEKIDAYMLKRNVAAHYRALYGAIQGVPVTVLLRNNVMVRRWDGVATRAEIERAL